MSAPEVPAVDRPDLVAYLRARLDEGEAAALQAQDMARYRDGMDIQWRWALLTKPTQFADGWSSSFEPGAPSPDEVLADIAAKRAVLDLYELSLAETRTERNWAFLEAPVPPMPTRTLPLGSTRGLELAVQALAQAYATRPGFDPSWRTDD